RPEDALKYAEQAVVACRHYAREGGEHQKCALVHSLTTLSNCLAAVGNEDEALPVAEEATSLYTANAPHMWGDLISAIRREELGGNAFHCLSLRLLAFERLEDGLLNAEKAAELYRQLILLAPRHLPTLASTLRIIASTLGKLGRLESSTEACGEAVDIMRKVVKNEAYFLPDLVETLDELGGYLNEQGELARASAITSERDEVRIRIAGLPQEPDYMLESIEMRGKKSEEMDNTTVSFTLPGPEVLKTSIASEAAVISTTRILDGETATMVQEPFDSDIACAGKQQTFLVAPDETRELNENHFPRSRKSEIPLAPHTEDSELYNSAHPFKRGNEWMITIFWLLLGLLGVLFATKYVG
ncbi:hypothetical protein B0H11DRAFT_2363218, partial [Mycena galericulata]